MLSSFFKIRDRPFVFLVGPGAGFSKNLKLDFSDNLKTFVFVTINVLFTTAIEA